MRAGLDLVVVDKETHASLFASSEVLALGISTYSWFRPLTCDRSCSSDKEMHFPKHIVSVIEYHGHRSLCLCASAVDGSSWSTVVFCRNGHGTKTTRITHPSALPLSFASLVVLGIP